MKKLELCPHCGGKAELKLLGGAWKIVCTNCYASSGLTPNEEDSARKWNNRAPDLTALKTALEEMETLPAQINAMLTKMKLAIELPKTEVKP